MASVEPKCLLEKVVEIVAWNKSTWASRLGALVMEEVQAISRVLLSEEAQSYKRLKEGFWAWAAREAFKISL